jgi:mannose/fructose-specific phosphotransferase system component IIA
MIVGETAPILAIDEGQNVDLSQVGQLKEYLDQNALIACDLLGGSPFLKIAEYTKARLPIVCGINVPFALEYLLSNQTLQDLLNQKELGVQAFKPSHGQAIDEQGGI